jgi:co-chaperonin GroES (HSP10)
MSDKYNALGEYIVVCLSTLEQQDKGGITVVRDIKMSLGTVISKGDRVSSQVEIGDKVLFFTNEAVAIDSENMMVILQDGVAVKVSEGGADGG